MLEVPNFTPSAGAAGEDEEERLKGEEGDRNSAGGIRWPRQETLALLKIRSEMDIAFRDSSVKAPLWEQVSRKLAELGFNRSAKKCKEKFENIYKYHRRTKEGRSGRPNGKNYRFFEQLEALDSHSLLTPASPKKFQDSVLGHSKETIDPLSFNQNVIPFSIQHPVSAFMDTSTSTMSSSSKEESEGTQKKKRKLTEFFESLMKQVIEKQDSLQRKFIEAMDKLEQDRTAREEVWKMQELDRIKRERELLVHERSIAAAKDAAVLAFLQKFSDETIPVQLPETPIPEKKVEDKQENNRSVENFINSISSRWPKEEVEALIKIRTNLDLQYHEFGPKAPLWEEISSAMKKVGYDRSAKRCKEKWENINKYFRKVKESNRKRPEDSKTCPYFYQLDALYKEKTKKIDPNNDLKPEELLMHMTSGQEEQQQQQQQQQQPESVNDGESENVDESIDDEDEDEDEGDEYQIVVNDPSSMGIMSGDKLG